MVTKIKDIIIKNATLTVIVHKEDKTDGGYVASVKELKGCITQGDTWDETVENIRDAIGEFMASFDHEYVLCQTMDEYIEKIFDNEICPYYGSECSSVTGKGKPCRCQRTIPERTTLG